MNDAVKQLHYNNDLNFFANKFEPAPDFTQLGLHRSPQKEPCLVDTNLLELTLLALPIDPDVPHELIECIGNMVI